MESREKKHIHIPSWPFLTFLAVILLAGAAYFFFILNRPGKSAEVLNSTEGDLRIGTVNIGQMKACGSQENTAEFLRHTLEKQSLDILCIQEYYSHWQFTDEHFHGLFSDLYPYFVADAEHAVLSRVPITGHELYKSQYMHQGSYMHTHFETADGKPFSIISVHLQSTGITLFKRAGKLDASVGGEVLESLKGNRELRIKQAEDVHALVANSTEPVFVCGDFNSLPLTRAQMKIKKGLKDAFLHCGHGSGCTFRSGRNLVRIDYILYGKSYEPLECIIENDYLSDHKMVVSTFRQL